METIEEFLVSVKYGVDEPSQAKFFDALKRVSTSIAGIAGQIVGLGIGILKLSDHMSEAGEKIYWMSQRTGESIDNIEKMTFALSNLGRSGDQAADAISQLATWSRERGPVAQMYLRTLGITATTTVGQLEQLGKRLASFPKDSIEYAIELQRMRQLGLNEHTLLAFADPRYEEGKRTRGMVEHAVWGNIEHGPEKWAEQSTKIGDQFRKMGLIFEEVSKRFGLGLFNKVLPELTRINDLLIKALPQINGFLDQLVSFAPTVLHFLEGAIFGFGHLLDMGGKLIKTFRDLPDALQYAVGAFLLLPKALNLLKSPLFWMLSGLTALLLLMDDYRGYQKDVETNSKIQHSYFNWSSFDKMFKGVGDAFKGLEDNKVIKFFMDLNKQAKEFVDHLTGIPGLFEGIEIAIAALIAKSLLKGGFKLLFNLTKGALLGGAAEAGAGAAGAGALGGLMGGVILPAAIVAVVTSIGTILAKALHDKLVELGISRKKSVTDQIQRGGTDPKTGQKVSPGMLYPWWHLGTLGPNDEREEAPQWAKDFLEWSKKRIDSRPALPPYLEEGVEPPAELMQPPKSGPRRENLPPSRYRPAPTWNPASRWGGPGKQGALTVPGSYQLASAGNDWTVPSSFGGSLKESEDRFRLFDMLKQHLDTIVEMMAACCQTLKDILNTLSDMADKAGAGREHRGGEEGGQVQASPGQGPSMSGEEQVDMGQKLMDKLKLPAESAAGIVNNIMGESGGRPDAVSSSGARGIVQWIPKRRWAPLVAWAHANGIDETTRDGQIEMLVHDMEQNYPALLRQLQSGNLTGEQAARLFSEVFEAGSPTSSLLTPDWYRTHTKGTGELIPRLRHVPIGGERGAWTTEDPQVGRGASREINVNNNTSIAVTAPNPASAAYQVAEAMPRIHETHIRHVRGALLA